MQALAQQNEIKIILFVVGSNSSLKVFTVLTKTPDATEHSQGIAS